MAAPLALQVLASNPRNHRARITLTRAHEGLEQWAKVIETTTDSLTVFDDEFDRLDALASRCSAYWKLGKQEESNRDLTALQNSKRASYLGRSNGSCEIGKERSSSLAFVDSPANRRRGQKSIRSPAAVPKRYLLSIQSLPGLCQIMLTTLFQVMLKGTFFSATAPYRSTLATFILERTSIVALQTECSSTFGSSNQATQMLQSAKGPAAPKRTRNSRNFHSRRSSVLREFLQR